MGHEQLQQQQLQQQQQQQKKRLRLSCNICNYKTNYDENMKLHFLTHARSKNGRQNPYSVRWISGDDPPDRGKTGYTEYWCFLQILKHFLFYILMFFIFHFSVLPWDQNPKHRLMRISDGRNVEFSP